MKPSKWPLFHHPDTPTYFKGRITLLGDSAHASSPSQAAGAGQGLEDAVMLARLLGLVRSADQIDSAIEIYDAMRRPRAQKVVRDSKEVGMAYYLLHPEFGHDLKKITAAANERLPQIWYHDVDGDLQRAEEMFFASLRKIAGKQMTTISVAEKAPQEIAI